MDFRVCIGTAVAWDSARIKLLNILFWRLWTNLSPKFRRGISQSDVLVHQNSCVIWEICISEPYVSPARHETRKIEGIWWRKNNSRSMYSVTVRKRLIGNRQSLLQSHLNIECYSLSSLDQTIFRIIIIICRVQNSSWRSHWTIPYSN